MIEPKLTAIKHYDCDDCVSVRRVGNSKDKSVNLNSTLDAANVSKPIEEITA